MSDRSYHRGTSKKITVNYTPLNGIAGSKVFFTVKANQYDEVVDDSSAIIKKTVSMSDNTATISLVPSTVPDSQPPGNYYYDIAVLDAASDIYVIDSGSFEITATPTNREA